MRYAIAGLLALLAASAATAQQNFDGKWSGQVGQWTVDLTVKGKSGDLAMACGSNKMFGSATVGPDGTVSGKVKSGTQLGGNLTSGVAVVAGGSCGDGKAMLVKK